LNLVRNIESGGLRWVCLPSPSPPIIHLSSQYFSHV
jgi:hypothetical protein